MALLVDTSVWFLAFRRDAGSNAPEVIALRRALDGAEPVVTTGLVFQELLQGATDLALNETSSNGLLLLRSSSRIAKTGFARPICVIGVAARAFGSARSTRCSRSSAFVTNCAC